MSSNYPPGVTGNEWAIQGMPPCSNCRHEFEDHSETDERNYNLCTVDGCECIAYDPYPQDPPERPSRWERYE